MRKIALLLATALAGMAAGAEDPNGDVAASLRQLNVQPSAESMAAFLRAVRPQGERGRQFAALIQQLGAESYRVREQASEAILASKVWYPEMLRAAAGGGDAEVRARSEQVLEKMGSLGAMEWEDAARLVLGAIAREKLPGLAEAVLELLGTSEALAPQAIAALRATARVGDLPLLHKLTRSEKLYLRVAAVRVLDALLDKRMGVELVDPATGEQARDGAFGMEILKQFWDLVGDAAPAVRVEAAVACLNRGHRPALGALVELMKSEDVGVRVRAYRALRAVTGRSFSFAPYGEAADRVEPLKQWAGWVERDGNSAVLKLPVPDAFAAVPAGLVLWNRLGSAAEIASSEMGPGGKWSKEGKFVRGVFGGAIEVEIKHKEPVTFPEGLVQTKEGCMEVWAQLVDFDQGTPDGHSPALVMTAEGAYIIMLNANDGGGRGGLTARAGPSGRCGTGQFGQWSLTRILGKGREAQWHHYALSWNVRGIPGLGDGRQTMAVFLDGKLNSSIVSAGAADTGAVKGKIVLFDQHHLSRGRVRLDNLKVWNVAKTDFSDRLEDDGVEAANKAELQAAPKAPEVEKAEDRARRGDGVERVGEGVVEENKREQLRQ